MTHEIQFMTIIPSLYQAHQGSDIVNPPDNFLASKVGWKSEDIVEHGKQFQPSYFSGVAIPHGKDRVINYYEGTNSKSMLVCKQHARFPLLREVLGSVANHHQSIILRRTNMNNSTRLQVQDGSDQRETPQKIRGHACLGSILSFLKVIESSTSHMCKSTLVQEDERPNKLACMAR